MGPLPAPLPVRMAFEVIPVRVLVKRQRIGGDRVLTAFQEELFTLPLGGVVMFTLMMKPHDDPPLSDTHL